VKERENSGGKKGKMQREIIEVRGRERRIRSMEN
jgi:hypothetical protein